LALAATGASNKTFRGQLEEIRQDASSKRQDIATKSTPIPDTVAKPGEAGCLN